MRNKPNYVVYNDFTGDELCLTWSVSYAKGICAALSTEYGSKEKDTFKYRKYTENLVKEGYEQGDDVVSVLYYYMGKLNREQMTFSEAIRNAPYISEMLKEDGFESYVQVRKGTEIVAEFV